jgi:polyisoprenoid-binding protein YceI
MTVRSIAVATVALLWATTAVAAHWEQDGPSSRLEFVATYEGQTATGRFADFNTRLTFDTAQPGQGSLQVSIVMASAQTGSVDVSRAIRDAEWFDIARYPRADFQSSQIQREGEGKFVARGRLTIKGIAQDVQVPFTWGAKGRTATMTGRIVLDRTAFQVGTGDWADGSTIDREVAVNFNVRLHRVD